MKTMKFWSWMIILLAFPLISACGSDDEENDNSIPFTTEILVDKNCFWDIKEITGSHSGFYKGASAEFFSNGTCDGFHSMETAYRITNGKLYTYYADTNEPMFVYALLSRFTNSNTDELTVRVDGTLDDKSSFTIVMQKNAKVAQVNQ